MFATAFGEAAKAVCFLAATGLLLCLAAETSAWAQPADTASPPRAVKAGIYVSPPFAVADDGRFSGMAIDLWEAVAANLNLATQYVRYPTLQDLITATRTGNVDVAVTNLTITRDRAEVLTFTQPWYDAGLRLMVPEEGSTGFRSVMTGLSNAGHLRAYAWLAFVIAIATIALTLFERRFDRDFSRRWREGLAESFYHVVSIVTSGRTAHKNLFGWMGRIWAAFWMVCGVAMVAYITSSVTSVMTAVSLEHGIDSLADLAEGTAGVFTGSVAEDYVTGLGIASRSYPDLDAAVEALKAGYVDAIVADAPVLEYYAHRHPEQKVDVTGNLFHPDKYGFAFPRDSDLALPATLQILDLHESGAIERLRLEYFGSSLTFD